MLPQKVSKSNRSTLFIAESFYSNIYTVVCELEFKMNQIIAKKSTVNILDDDLYIADHLYVVGLYRTMAIISIKFMVIRGCKSQKKIYFCII